MRKNQLILAAGLAVGGFLLYKGGTTALSGLQKSIEDALKGVSTGVSGLISSVPSVGDVQLGAAQMASQALQAVSPLSGRASLERDVSLYGAIVGGDSRYSVALPGANSAWGGTSTYAEQYKALEVASPKVQPAPIGNSSMSGTAGAATVSKVSNSPSTSPVVYLNANATQTTYVTGGKTLNYVGTDNRGRRVYK